DGDGDRPLGIGHLVVDLPEHRCHLLAHPPGNDHQVGLARRVGGALHAEPGQVVTRPADGKELYRATGQAERGGPHRALARVPGQLLDRGERDPAWQLFFYPHTYPQFSPPRRHTYTYATSTVAIKSTISTSPNTPRLVNVTAHGYRKMISMSKRMNSIAVT